MTSVVTAKVRLNVELLSGIMHLAFDMPDGKCWSWAEPGGDDVLEGQYGGPATGERSDIWYSTTIKCSATNRTHCVGHYILSIGVAEILRSPGFKHHSKLLRAIAHEDANKINSEIADHIVQYGLWREVRY